MDFDLQLSVQLIQYKNKVEKATGRTVIITLEKELKTSGALIMGPEITNIVININPNLLEFPQSFEKTIAHELTHAIMYYSLGYELPCGPDEVSEDQIQIVANIIDMIDDIIIDIQIFNLGFIVPDSQQLKDLEHNANVFQIAKSKNQIDSHESNPNLAEISLVGSYLYAWVIPKYIPLTSNEGNIFKKLVRRFPEIFPDEYKKAKAIKKIIRANDMSTYNGRMNVVQGALSLWPIDERIYLAKLDSN